MIHLLILHHLLALRRDEGPADQGLSKLERLASFPNVRAVDTTRCLAPDAAPAGAQAQCLTHQQCISAAVLQLCQHIPQAALIARLQHEAPCICLLLRGVL